MNEIRFIDSRYNELFSIPDGGRLQITRSNGDTSVKECEYLDEYHFKIKDIGNTYATVYHICQFAELMESIGSKYEPIIEKNYELEPAETDEESFVYGNSDKEQRGCVGRLRCDFGRDGNSFFSSWENEMPELRTEEFSKELNDVVNYLRLSADIPLMRSSMDLKRACRELKSSRISSSWTEMFVFKIKTERYTHFLRCCPKAGDYNIYLYSYDTERLNKYKDICYVKKEYGDIKADKFFKTETGIVEVYYNPDSTSGGQLVYTEFDSGLISEAAKNCRKTSDFFDSIAANGRVYLIDVGTPGFRSDFESFIKRTADFEGCTKKTMDGLKKYAGIESQKKNRDMER